MILGSLVVIESYLSNVGGSQALGVNEARLHGRDAERVSLLSSGFEPKMLLTSVFGIATILPTSFRWTKASRNGISPPSLRPIFQKS